jgi:hypothetical protein
MNMAISRSRTRNIHMQANIPRGEIEHELRSER